MIICDRCGEKIIDQTDKTKQTLFVYEAAAAGIWHEFDLCRDCLRELEDYKKRAESYFMVNKDKPRNIFDNVKYWSK